MQVNRRMLLAAGALPLAAAAPEPGEDAGAVVQRQAQALCDAVSAGDAAVWSRLLHPDVAYTDEEGTLSGKAELVAQIQPLPPGVSGVLKVIEFKARRHGGIIVATYVVDETERYHGAQIHCQYRNTDTWVSTADGWRLIGLQAMALRTDPPAVTLAGADLDACAGLYRLSPDTTYAVRRAGAALEGLQSGGKPRPLLAEARDVFFNPGRPRYRFLFQRDGEGRVVRMVERREAWDLVWARES